jgi:SAM-dependent methyltransferase
VTPTPGELAGERIQGSFRDPAGFVFRREGVLYRQVNEAHRDAYDLFVASGLARRLQTEGSLIPFEEVDVEPATADAYKVLRPHEIEFVSYPYEWSFSQLRDAALATLDAGSVALDHGMSLRDASAYNVQFHEGRPVVIDTLSFDPRGEGPWPPYRQFCSHFLAPLALMSARDVRLGLLLREHIDGIPLDLAATLLPRRARLRPGLAMHVVAHARSQRRHGSDGERMETYRKRFSDSALRGLLDSLRSVIRSLAAPRGDSTWRDYYDEASHYTDDASASKESTIESFLDQVAPATVWDLGANTGRFSRLASRRGIHTVAFDLDPYAVETAYASGKERDDRHLLPLVLDLTNPSPAIGWANTERMTIAERGPADLVLSLALVHHLAIGNNVPLPMISEYLASLGRHLAVEFVPKDDVRVRQLLSSRDDIFPAYTTEGFEDAFSARFEIVRREPVTGSSRLLYLMRSR